MISQHVFLNIKCSRQNYTHFRLALGVKCLSRRVCLPSGILIQILLNFSINLLNYYFVKSKNMRKRQRHQGKKTYLLKDHICLGLQGEPVEEGESETELMELYHTQCNNFYSAGHFQTYVFYRGQKYTCFSVPCERRGRIGTYVDL